MAPLTTLSALTVSLLAVLSVAAPAPNGNGTCSDGILFKAYTSPSARSQAHSDASCTGPSTTKCFPKGKCNNLAKPAYSWSSVGGFPAQGQLYVDKNCQGKSFTEHFDADNVCFDPSGLAGTGPQPNGTKIWSFFVPSS